MSKVTLNPNDVLRQMAQQLGLKPFTLTSPDGTTYEMYATHTQEPTPPTNGTNRAEQLRRARIKRAQHAYWTPEQRAAHSEKLRKYWATRSRK